MKSVTFSRLALGMGSNHTSWDLRVIWLAEKNLVNQCVCCAIFVEDSIESWWD